MKISILGSGPLANATAHCCRQHFEVVQGPAWDADVHWMCFETPIAPSGEPNVEAVLAEIYPYLREDHAQHFALISSQLPVGTMRPLQSKFPGWHFAYNPENIRHASAIEDFRDQARIVVGCGRIGRVKLLKELFAPFTKKLIFTDIPTAELIKSATNAFHAMSIAFQNEIADICDLVGANELALTEALKADPRLGVKSPGKPYSGGHLEREIFTLNRLASDHKLSLPIIQNIARSNRGET